MSLDFVWEQASYLPGFGSGLGDGGAGGTKPAFFSGCGRTGLGGFGFCGFSAILSESYDPRLLAEKPLVDRLSLALSLAHVNDDRVQIAIEELLGGVPW